MSSQAAGALAIAPVGEKGANNISPQFAQFDQLDKRIDRQREVPGLKRARSVSQFRRRSQQGSRFMSLESHLAELERRHQAMEQAIASEKTHPAADDLKLIELKRKKLVLKDEIEKLRQERLLATTH